jgi:periplasmic protein CpxP/Spy
MKRCMLLFTVLALCSCAWFISTQKSYAQSGQGAQKIEHLAKELKLTPQQKAQLMPILEAEAPQLKAIKANTSLSKSQRLEQLKAVHDQTDPQVKSILTPEQYQKLQEIRQKEVEQAIKKKRSQ